MSLTQLEKAARFRALHEGAGTFLIPNPWDAASARILEGLGFQALATSSAASAAMIGRRDGGLKREEALELSRLIAHAVDVPVSADLENGFGDAAETVAETIRLAAGVGLVGCSIEDSTGDPACPLYEPALAAERIAAAAEAARALPFPFLVTARAHNFLHSAPSLHNTIRRLQAFEKAGADVLFAPGKGKSFTVAELAAAGVKRISLATSLYRAAMTGLIDAAIEVRDKGEFGFLDRSATTADLNKLMRT